MTRAILQDKTAVVALLSKAFHDNQSVNYIIQQDERRLLRIQALMDYSFELCFRYGAVLWSEQRDACALLLFPDRKKTSLQSVLLDLQLAVKSIGVRNIRKVLQREAYIKSQHPGEAFAYLWFIGVEPARQGQGCGSALVEALITWCARQGRNIYLETSTPRNLPFYQKMGFHNYHHTDRFGYPLYFFRHTSK
ncbi:GNAT family N-acetyltransferase [Cnuella takakiae]|nr:GNAT family N-acetyltransferase [Cnuella takakiae]OLY90668.1 hypothetical protein BUE76_01190 [Cnuella takakiae]